MTLVAPSQPRFSIEGDVYGPRIVIPARRSTPVALFLCVWLCGWAAGEYFALQGLFSPASGLGPKAFLLVWLTMWTFGGFFALLGVAWQLGGRELISIDRGRLVVRHEALGLGRTKEFELRDIRDLRVQQMDAARGARGLQGAAVGFTSGTIAFDYGASTYRFGVQVEEAEAKMIVEEVGKWVERG